MKLHGGEVCNVYVFTPLNSREVSCALDVLDTLFNPSLRIMFRFAAALRCVGVERTNGHSAC